MLQPEKAMYWTLNTDGATNKFRVRVGVVLELATWVIIEEEMYMKWKMTNSEAEYEALIFGLGLAQNLGVRIQKVI